MRFEVLGPLQVRDQSGVIRIPVGQAERLLAVLLSHQGARVSAAALIDALWPESSSKAPRKNLQVTVLRLRRALGGGERITQVGGGYVLRLQPGEFDAQVFADLVAEAQRSRRSGEDAHAIEVYAEALKLWRGSPYSCLEDFQALTPEIHRLHELRFKALEDHAEACLALGRHGELVPRLSTLIAGHPIRERLVSLLMLAFYRSNRQADALELYRRTRAILIGEHGVEPGSSLRALHEQILRADPALDLGRVVIRGSVKRAVPAQLPAGVRGFVGRDSEFAQLTALVPSSGESPATIVISAVAGTAGVGKTTLAVQWAHQVRDRFPDGQLYVNLRGFDPSGNVMSPSEALRGFLDAFDVPPERVPTDLDARSALYRSLLDGKRVLVVLDNARDTAQIRTLLPGSPGCMIVVTSRNDLSALVAYVGAYSITLDLLTQSEARQLMECRLGADRVAAEPEAVKEIIESCSRLPLALAIVAARATTHPQLRLAALAALAAELRRGRTSLDVFASGDAGLDLRAVFDWSYQQLSTDAARLFRLLGLHPGPDVSAPAAASLAGVPLAELQPLLGELCHIHLIREHAPGRHSFHDLLRAYAGELAHAHDTDDDRSAATRRLLDHYLHSAFAARRMIDPHAAPIAIASTQPGVTPEQPADQQQAMAWFTAEHHVLLAVLRYAATAGFDTHAWQLVWTLDLHLYRRGHWQDQAAAWNSALEASKRLGDGAAQARAHRDLAGCDIRLGHPFGAALSHLQEALDLYVELDDRIGQAHTHRQFAELCGRQGHHADALAHHQQALDLFRACGQQRGQALVLNAIGWQQAEHGDHQLALVHCKQALGLFHELGDRECEADTWDSLGYVHHHLGQFEDGAFCYQQALDLFREVGNRYEEAATLGRLGENLRAAGDMDAARRSWRHALAILEELGHPDAEAVRTKLHDLEARPGA